MTVDELGFRDLMARSHELREAFAELMTQSLAIRDEVQRRRASELAAATAPRPLSPERTGRTFRAEHV